MKAYGDRWSEKFKGDRDVFPSVNELFEGLYKVYCKIYGQILLVKKTKHELANIYDDLKVFFAKFQKVLDVKKSRSS